ncbi:MAG: amidohydrolase, partial [Acidobacteriota bacterium]|nr:amidohydrolase [Acidobacteriota bacterium]
ERAGLINYVSPDIIGFTAEVNDWVAKYCQADPSRLIPFGSVHPRFIDDAGKEVDRLAKLGIRGLKLHPSHQVVAPNAYLNGMKQLSAMYERAQAHRMPVMIHTGTSIFPGARNLYAQPMLADDVAVDYPDLPIILAHGGRPLWMNEAFFLVRRHENVVIDVSSIPPQSLLQYFPRLEEIADKALFGSDWPGPGVPDVAGNIRKFKALPLSSEAQQKILYDNAARMFPPR